MKKSNKSWPAIIGILSVVVPLLVAYLLFGPQSDKSQAAYVAFLPHLNAVLNSATAIALIIGFYFIKNRRKQSHKTAMLSAFALSSLFLISYVIYHYMAPHTSFPETGFYKYFYYFILITHIILAAVVVPFVLFALYFAFTRQIGKHKKVVKWTFPIWLYVAVSGVGVYLMISPYYVN